jgi:hypothetical protein
MRLLWVIPLLWLPVSLAFLTRAIYVHRRSRLPLPPSLLAGIPLNAGLTFLVVSQFLDIPPALKWIILAVSGLLIAYTYRLLRRPVRRGS